jgi:hypothetical protein
MRTLWRLFRFAIQSILRNIWLSFATVTVLVLTLLTVNAVIAMNVLADAAVRSVESRLSVDIYFNNGVPVSMSGSVTGLANTSWTTVNAEMSGGTWTPGQEFLVRIRSYAKDSFQVHIGTLKMQYVDLRPQ